MFKLLSSFCKIENYRYNFGVIKYGNIKYLGPLKRGDTTKSLTGKELWFGTP